jgi:hypothetical protein
MKQFSTLFALVAAALLVNGPAFAGFNCIPVVSVPEPVSLALLVGGIGGLAVIRRHRK